MTGSSDERTWRRWLTGHARVVLSLACVITAAIWMFWGRIGPGPPVPSALHAMDPDLAALVRRGVEAVSSNRHDPRPWMKLGMIYDANALFTHARTCYERVTRLDENAVLAWRRLATTRERLSDLRGAIESMRRSITIDPTYAPAHWQTGLWLLDVGRPDEAETALRRAVDLADDDEPAWFGLARLHVTRRENQAAIDVIEGRRLTAGANGPYAYHLLATAYRQMNRPAEAEAALAHAAGTRPRFGLVWTKDLGRYRTGDAARRGEIREYVRTGQLARAIPVLERLSARHPDDTKLLNDLAECYLRTDRHDDALPVLASVFAIDPDDHRANVNTALAMLGAGRSAAVDYHEALDHVDRALRRGPPSPRARRVRAAVLVALDRVDEAISALEAIFRDDSRDVTPLIEAARVQAVHGRLADAVSTFTRALDVRPDEPRAAVGLVEVLLAQGAVAEAETALRRAAALPGIDPRRLEALRGRLEEARRSR